MRPTLKPLRKHFEQRQDARSAHRNKRESKCEAAMPTRHRTRYPRRCRLTAPLLHTAAAFRHTLSTAGAVVRYLPCSKCLGSVFALRSTLRTRQEHHHLLPKERCTRIIRLAAERICRQWNTSANILRFALHGGQRHGSPSICRSDTDLCSNCLCAAVRPLRSPHEHSRQ